MKRILKLMAIMLATATFAFVIASCGEDENAPAEVSAVTIAPYKHTFRVGSKVILTANVSPVNSAVETVTWNSSASNVAAVSSIGATTAELRAIAVGETTVSVATANGKTATCAVTVLTAIPMTEVAIETDETEMLTEGTLQLVATPVPASATDFEPEWSSSDRSVLTVSQTGLVTGLAAGTATVTVASAGFSDSVEIRVIQRVRLTGLAVTPSEDVTLLPGGSKQYTVALVPEDANDYVEPEWSSSNPAVATVSETGLVTAVEEGTAAITVTSGNITTTIGVTVVEKMPFRGPHILSAAAPYELRAVDFDYGGEGVGFHETSTNSIRENPYRRAYGDELSDAVRMDGGADPTNISYTNPGEWLRYTLDVQDAGTYTVDIYLAIGDGNQIYVSMDGVVYPKVEPTIPSSAEWQNYFWAYERYPQFVQPTFNLSVGKHEFKLHMDSGGFNPRLFKFTRIGD